MSQKIHITDADTSNSRETPDEIAEKLRAHPDNYWTLRNKLIVISTGTSTVGLAVSLISLAVAITFAAKQHHFQEKGLLAQKEISEKELNRQEELRKQDLDRAWLLKEIDIRQSCQQRYDDLAYDTKARAKHIDDAKGYYKRFWDLQFEQYQYCMDRVINTSIFATWMGSRKREFDEDESVGKMGYREGWKYMAQHFTRNDHGNVGAYTEFVAFMNDVFAGKQTTCNPPSAKP